MSLRLIACFYGHFSNLSLSLVPPPCCAGESKDPSLEHTGDT